METSPKEQFLDQIRGFSLPRYEQIPEVGLYLEQVAVYITDHVRGMGCNEFTGSMIRNYVKQGLVSNPVKKRYSREQIARLFFIAVGKNVLSMEDIRLLFRLQEHSYLPQRAYDYFCNELENVLRFVFGIKDRLDTVGVDDSQAKDLLRTAIIAVAHKAYLDTALSVLHSQAEDQSTGS